METLSLSFWFRCFSGFIVISDTTFHHINISYISEMTRAKSVSFTEKMFIKLTQWRYDREKAFAKNFCFINSVHTEALNFQNASKKHVMVSE